MRVRVGVLQRQIRHQLLHVSFDQLAKLVTLRRRHSVVVGVRIGVDAHGRISAEHRRGLRGPPLPQRALRRLARRALVRHERVDFPRHRCSEFFAPRVDQSRRPKLGTPQVRQRADLR